MSEPMLCVHCGRPMRPFHAKISDYPGTVKEQRAGVCASCARRRSGHHAPLSPLPLSADERTVLRMVERRCEGDERSRVAAILGVAGRGAA